MLDVFIASGRCMLLQAFDGAIVAITHNKAFADNLRATHVLRVQVCNHSRCWIV